MVRVPDHLRGRASEVLPERPSPEEPKLIVLASLLVLSAVTTAVPAALPTAQQNALFQNQARAAVASDLHKEVKLSGDPANPQPPYGMVLIPAGPVIMGTEVDRVPKLGQNNELQMREVAAETPRHSVEIDQYYLDAMEVTNLQWKVYLDATKREASDVLVEYGWPGGKIPDGQEYYPITNVSLPEIEDFLAWCGKRLPTEAEWTRAARGDDTRDYPWGERWNSKVVKYGGSPPLAPVAVSEYEDGQSPFGVLNMAGNVFEWVDSAFTPFEDFEPIPFKVGRERRQLTPDFDSRRRVAKGGCFVSTRDQARIDFRLSLDPNESDAALGFRAARSVHRGVEVIHSAYRRLLPPLIPTEAELDDTDIFAEERASYLEGSDGTIISGFRYLAFAHPKPKRQPGLARMRKSARDEPVTLGLISTSEGMESPALPPGEYVVAFKARGESKKHKEKRRNEKKDGRKSEPAPVAGGEGASPGGGLAPWPGIAVNDVLEDIDFDQDADVFLFYNVNNAVVGWVRTGDILETAKDEVTWTSDSDGRTWEIQFSIDVIGKRVPRFTLPITLHGPGLGKDG